MSQLITTTSESLKNTENRENKQK